MREIILVSSKPFSNIKTLIVNRIVYRPLRAALLESNINPDNPKQNLNALIFTSQNALNALLEEIKLYPKMSEFRNIPSFAIGERTGNALKNANFCVKYISSQGSGDGFAHDISELLRGQSALYFRAKNIVSNISSKLLGADVKLAEIIAYESAPLRLPQSDKPAAESILIFTAPSHYHAFCANFGWEREYIAVAIGESTFRAFGGDVVGYISPKQNIESCVELARSIAVGRHIENPDLS